MKWEAAIMIKDRLNTSLSELDQARKNYHKGDIVEVLPEGSDWGTEFPKMVLIVPVGEMTKEEAKELKSSVLVEDVDADGNAIQEFVVRRKHNIDIDEMDRNIAETGIKHEIEDMTLIRQPFKNTPMLIRDKSLSAKVMDRHKVVATFVEKNKITS